MTDQEIKDAKLRIGVEIERFQTSEFGKTMIELAGLRSHSALQNLAKADPYKPDEIIKMQNEVACGDRFIEYMNELLEEAENVMSQRALDESDD